MQAGEALLADPIPLRASLQSAECDGLEKFRTLADGVADTIAAMLHIEGKECNWRDGLLFFEPDKTSCRLA